MTLVAIRIVAEAARLIVFQQSPSSILLHKEHIRQQTISSATKGKHRSVNDRIGSSVPIESQRSDVGGCDFNVAFAVNFRLYRCRFIDLVDFFNRQPVTGIVSQRSCCKSNLLSFAKTWLS